MFRFLIYSDTFFQKHPGKQCSSFVFAPAVCQQQISAKSKREHASMFSPSAPHQQTKPCCLSKNLGKVFSENQSADSLCIRNSASPHCSCTDCLPIADCGQIKTRTCKHVLILLCPQSADWLISKHDTGIEPLSNHAIACL